MNKCAVCGEVTKRPIIATLYHFRLIDFDQWAFVRGTFKAFGIGAVLSLVSPIYNTLRHWKYRKSQLVIPGVDKLPRE